MKAEQMADEFMKLVSLDASLGDLPSVVVTKVLQAVRISYICGVHDGRAQANELAAAQIKAIMQSIPKE